MKSNAVKFLLFNFFLILFIFISCSKEIKKDIKPGANKSTPAESTLLKNSEEIEKKYLKEGFISRNIFRVIVISTRDEYEDSINSIQEKARKRAFVSLQRFLIQKDRNIDQNVKAKILNMINQDGKFIRKDTDCKKNYLFYLDIEKNNIKNYLINTTRK